MNPTVWWQSKALWVAFLAFAATAAQAKWGLVIDPLYQGYALAIIMALIRLVTTGPLTATATSTPVQDAQDYAAQAAATADKADAAAVGAEKVLAKELAKATEDKTGGAE